MRLSLSLFLTVHLYVRRLLFRYTTGVCPQTEQVAVLSVCDMFVNLCSILNSEGDSGFASAALSVFVVTRLRGLVTSLLR